MKLIRCECGFVARGDSDDQVVGMIRGHMAADHPALLETVSRDDLVSWIQAELPGSRPKPAMASQGSGGSSGWAAADVRLNLIAIRKSDALAPR